MRGDIHGIIGNVLDEGCVWGTFVSCTAMVKGEYILQ